VGMEAERVITVGHRLLPAPKRSGKILVQNMPNPITLGSVCLGIRFKQRS
jgi:hypothetical protein